jgi:FKBP-type peptidyl-prolyl cis-trans isomerase
VQASSEELAAEGWADELCFMGLQSYRLRCWSSVNSRVLTPLLLILLLIGCAKAEENKVAIIPSAVSVVSGEQPPVVKETDVIGNLSRPTTLEERFSYTYGYMLYNTLLQQQGFGDLDERYFAKGALDAANRSGFFSQNEMAQTLYEVQAQLLQIAQQEVEALAQANLDEAELFLSVNGEQEGVNTTDSGLQYEVIEEGSGEHPTLYSTVVLDYTISLIGGRVVDSSADRGGPVTLRLSSLGVKGFVEGVSLMQQGGHYRFYLHPSLAWGKEGNLLVEPNTLLVVEVTLHSLNGGE